MASDEEFLIRVKADIKQAVSELKKLPKEISATGKASKKAGAGINSMDKGLRSLTTVAAAYLSIRMAVSLVKQADAFNVLNVRIKTATRDTGDYVKVQRELFRISQQNGSEFATTVQLFQGLARSAPELKTNNDEILKLVNTVQQLGVISGASQASMRAGLLQFSQGLASGVFRAEEFNSILENLPEVAARLAKGMGVSVGELRKMVINGKLLSKDVFDALVKQSAEINREFKDIPDSVGRSTTTMSEAFSRFLSQLDKAGQGTGIIAKTFQLVAESLNNFSDRLAENEFDELVRKRQEAGERYTQLLELGASKESLAINELLTLIDKYDARIIAINKNKIKTFNEKPKLKDQSGQPLEEISKKELDTAAAEKDRIKRLALLNKMLVKQGTLYKMDVEQVALYELKQLGASDADIKRAKAIFENIRAKEELNTIEEQGKKIYEETRTEMEKYSAEIQRINDLYEKGAFGAVGSAKALDTYSRKMFQLEENFVDVKETGEDTFAGLTAATRGWGREFTNTLADMVKNGKLNFSSLADSIISDLLRIMIYQQVTAPLFAGFGIPGFAPVKHSGGIIGSSGGTSRQINPFAFAGAKRYHTGGFPGLRSDEVPAILQKGELVLSKKQVASGISGGGSVKVEIVNRGSPSQVTDSTVSADVDGSIIRVVIDDIDRGGGIRDRIKAVSSE